PLKITTSRGASGATPSGFCALTSPCADVVGPPPLVAHADSTPAPGTVSRPAAASCRRNCLRSSPGRGLFITCLLVRDLLLRRPRRPDFLRRGDGCAPRSALPA